MIHHLDTARAARLASAIGARKLTLSVLPQAAEHGLRAAWRRDPADGRLVMQWSRRKAPPAAPTEAEMIDARIASVLTRHRSLRAA